MDSLMEKAVELYKSGVSITRISGCTMINRSTLIYRLKKMGIYEPVTGGQGARGDVRMKKEAAMEAVVKDAGGKAVKVEESGKPAGKAAGKAKAVVSKSGKQKVSVKSEKLEKQKVSVKQGKPASRKKKDEIEVLGGKVTVEKKKRKKLQDDHFVSVEEKVAYCNDMYGAGNYRFMSRDEVLDLLCIERGIVR